MEQEILCKLHQTEQEMLDLAVDICIKNHLTYYLVGGTALGAARHQGFIPWDDDLDIALPREEYTKFLEACEKELPEGYMIQAYTTDPGLWFPYAKIQKEHTLFIEKDIQTIDTHKGIFIDVFPLDYSPYKNRWYRKYQKKAVTKISRHLLWKKGLKKRGAVKDLIHILLSVVPDKKWNTIRNYLMTFENEKGDDYYINYAGRCNHIKETVPREYFGVGTELLFEGKYYNAPVQYENYLAHIYGNWRELPPVEERFNHNPLKVVFDTRIEES